MNTLKTACLVLALLFGLAAAPLGFNVAAGEIGTVAWPEEWTVFAPMGRDDVLQDVGQLASVPAALSLSATPRHPAREIAPQRFRADPGAPANLSGFFEERRVGNVAYAFLEIVSPRAQRVEFGAGADWWLQVWLNGEEVFSTMEDGNGAWPISILNHRFEANLREGVNVLAVRFVTGQANALLALGEAGHFPAEEARLAEQRRRMRLNQFPERFSDRLRFPVEEQAVATANMGIDFPAPDPDLAAGGLAGLREMPARQVRMSEPSNGRSQLVDTISRRFDEPVAMMLSKYRYPWEDRHLDAVVWTTPPEGQALRGHLEVVLKGEGGETLARQEAGPLSPNGLFFSVGFPEALRGRQGALEAIWRQDGRVVGGAERTFHVREAADVPLSGRVPLRILNEPGASLSGAPMTVGVPFPRGALQDEANVRLVDEGGGEMPLQTRVMARWSRFGPVKWLLCDFIADLRGDPRTLHLEYGPEIRRQVREPMRVEAADAGFPPLDAGRVRVSPEGLHFDPHGDGNYRPVLGPGAMAGAFVRHESGILFTVPADIRHEVEEHGSEKAVVRRTGWYADGETGERFCQFVTRFVFHRDSPVVRIFHTWIFTGDGNRDRIWKMGWRFDGAQPVEAEGFLTAFGGEWAQAEHLVHFGHRQYALAGQQEPVQGRAPGVLSASVGDVRVLFGAKDFWQNFPSELGFEGDAFAFFNWPAHNRPATFERPVTREKAFLHRFAHEGEVLDFRLPDEYAEGRIWREACGREGHWAEGRPETANAQGIARTEEMFLLFSDSSTSADAAALVMQGLNDESLRAVADPQWVAYSGAFGEIHHRDVENYPEDEHLYDSVVQAPARWNERLGVYGMWLYGDVPAWQINQHNRTVSLYRTYRKNHHGWPVGWVPYARSGDPELHKIAEAATRQMIDANFCHYADERVDTLVGPNHFRRQGWWDRSLLQWASRRGPHLRTYTVDCDYIWHAYYLTGFARARDVALLFGELTQHDYRTTGASRTTYSMMVSYLDMYQATFDPWFLVASHELAKLHMHHYLKEEPSHKLDYATVGHFWRPSDIAFHRFTGSDEYRRMALDNAVSWSSPRAYAFGGLWTRLSLPLIAHAAYAFSETGDEFHLARAAAYLDWTKTGVYDGDLEYAKGSISQGSTSRGIYTGYYISQFPLALGAFERAGRRPEPIPNPFYVVGTVLPGDDEHFEFRQPEILLRKDGAELVSLMLASQQEVEGAAYSYEIVGPDGGTLDEGPWPVGNGRVAAWVHEVSIPAEAPEGIYRLRVGGRVPLPGGRAARSRIARRHGRVLVPAAPPDVPEVMVFERGEGGTRVPSASSEIQYWFLVPEGVGEYWIDFMDRTSDLNRVSVWNPEGERVWDRSYHGDAPERASIPVPPAHAGRLWRATGGRFAIDPQIPPVFSASRAKWFDPEE